MNDTLSESVSSEQAPNIEELVARHRQAKRWRLFCQLVAVILGLASLVVGNFVITLYPSAQPIVTFLVLGTILAVVIRYLLHVKEVRLAQQLRRAGFPEY